MSVKNLMETLSGLIHVIEAAKFLGFSRETIRDWHKSGILAPTLHLVTVHRYDLQGNLAAFLKRTIEERSAFTVGTR